MRRPSISWKLTKWPFNAAIYHATAIRHSGTLITADNVVLIVKASVPGNDNGDRLPRHDGYRRHGQFGEAMERRDLALDASAARNIDDGELACVEHISGTVRHQSPLHRADASTPGHQKTNSHPRCLETRFDSPGHQLTESGSPSADQENGRSLHRWNKG
jgi:hypothetical protein